MKIKKSQLIRIIKEEVSKALEVTRPLPVYEAEGESKFTDENGEQWNVDCKSKYAMSCGDGCSAKPFRAFSPDDQKKLGDMCTLSESKSQPQKITRSQLRKLISEAEDTDKGGMKTTKKSLIDLLSESTGSRWVDNQIQRVVGHVPDSHNLVVNFFKHMGTHGATWDGKSLQVAFQNLRTKPGGMKNIDTLIQWISWSLKGGDPTAGKNLEDALEGASDFGELNTALSDASDVANAWWPDSPGGKLEKKSGIRAAAEKQ
jgi:hypothetical protein